MEKTLCIFRTEREVLSASLLFKKFDKNVYVYANFRQQLQKYSHPLQYFFPLSVLHPRFIHLLFFFLSPQLSVWTLLSSPTLTAPVLTFHFWFPPVNLNTGQVFPPAQISALKGTDSPHCWALTLFFSAYFQSSGLFLTHAEHEEMTDEHFWSFTFSESSVTSTILDLHDFIQRFEWKPAYDASLRVMWHLKDPKICHYEWTPCVNVGHPCLISHFINWKVKAQYGYSWLSNQEPIRPWLHKGLLWHFATFAATFSLRFHIFVSVL